MRNGGFRVLAGESILTGLICGLALMAAAAQANAKPQEAGNAPSQPQAMRRTDASREELANLDRFLDSHPVLERELGSNPSLVNDPEYVQKEPDLQIFLGHHPEVKAQLQRDPQYLARRANFAELNASDRTNPNPSPSLNQAEAGQMNGFLDAHSDIRELLGQNPALIDDSTFLDSHPDLETFVRQHPRARDEFVQNPRYFIVAGRPRNVPGESAAASRAEPALRKAAPPDVPKFEFGVSQEDIARMDQFLEDNPKIARDLRKDPLLVTSHKYLDHHRDLRRFFDEHLRVREAFAENPRYFVPGNGLGAAPPPLQVSEDQHLGNRDLADMTRFLRKHKDIAKRIESNPLVVRDLDFLHHHGDLREFFDEHPHIQIEFDEHPHYFLQREDAFRQNENLEVRVRK
jgi:hypothetical protein